MSCSPAMQHSGHHATLCVLSFMLFFLSLCVVAVGQHSCGGEGVCSLNGVCNATTRLCHCDPDWTGPNCSVLKALDAGTAAFRQQSASSAGSVVHGEDGLVHMFVEEVAGGCPLRSLNHYGQITRAVAENFHGPFMREGVAIGMFASNPHALRSHGGGFLLFFVANSEDAHASSFGASGGGACEDVAVSQRCIFVLKSQNASGPWIRGHAVPVVCDSLGDHKTEAQLVGSPSAIQLPNGTVLLFHTLVRPNAREEARLSLAVASIWHGPYRPQSMSVSISVNCDCCVARPHTNMPQQSLGEDPVVWRNRRGEFHMLTHACYGSKHQERNGCGQHAFSADGIKWTFSPDVPYFVQNWSMRDRPRVHTSNGIIQYLYNGVVPLEAEPYGFNAYTAVFQVTPEAKQAVISI